MRCANCDREFDETGGDCPYCGAVPESALHTLSGARLSKGAAGDEADGRAGAGQSGPRVYFKTISFSSRSFLKQLLFAGGLLLAAFIVLPAFLFLALGLYAVWLLLRLFLPRR
jgi:hypothetical protein